MGDSRRGNSRVEVFERWRRKVFYKSPESDREAVVPAAHCTCICICTVAVSVILRQAVHKNRILGFIFELRIAVLAANMSDPGVHCGRFEVNII